VSTHAPHKNIIRSSHLCGSAKIPSPPKTKWTVYKNFKEFGSPRKKRSNQCYTQWGSCTLLHRRWTTWECQLAHADQNRDRSIGLQCHIARHEVSTHAPHKNIIRSAHLCDETKIPSPEKTKWTVCKNFKKSTSPRHRKAIRAINLKQAKNSLLTSKLDNVIFCNDLVLTYSWAFIHGHGW
jgi:hypothetical protein